MPERFRQAAQDRGIFKCFNTTMLALGKGRTKAIEIFNIYVDDFWHVWCMVYCAKMAERIEMRSSVNTDVGRRNIVLDGALNPTRGGGKLPHLDAAAGPLTLLWSADRILYMGAQPHCNKIALDSFRRLSL